MRRQLTPSEIIILDATKSLTEKKAYGKVEIVIRAGSIELVQISENIMLPGQREEPASGGKCKMIG